MQESFVEEFIPTIKPPTMWACGIYYPDPGGEVVPEFDKVVKVIDLMQLVASEKVPPLKDLPVGLSYQFPAKYNQFEHCKKFFISNAAKTGVHLVRSSKKRN